ncbi:hypothetical protein MMC15_001194 [Xylographa vitiligo]|nr:hypothetical protein [Xylographa vitiligo]
MNPPPPPPPPPPPHGDTSGTRSGLPPGNYDIFIIPPHSAGSGFLYLPSLQPHRNSFLAGVASTLLAVAIWTIVFPVLKEWFATIVASGGTGVILLLIGVGVAGWAWGKTQLETGGSTTGGSAGGAPSSHPNPGASNTYANANSSHNTDPPPGTTGGMPEPTPGPSAGARPPPKPTWQRNNTGPAPPTNPTSAKTGWEKAREETRKKEEERRKADEVRKKREEDLKRREEEEKERVKQREKDAREREARERREKAAAAAAAAAAKAADPPPPSHHKPPPPTTSSRPSSPTKKPPPPTAHTAPPSTYSFRPYDTPKVPHKPSHKSSASSVYSAASSIPSQSTARTTPPPSVRGPYATKDPDKIVLQAVYAFTSTFTKMPVAQLVSGAGAVTDGLVLRITTEGLFIDDDVRGVPQREWDVKAWTMRLVEVSVGFPSPCIFLPIPLTPPFRLLPQPPPLSSNPTSLPILLLPLLPPPPNQATTQLTSLPPSREQSGEYASHHVLRASIRDQDAKRYVFVLQEAEAWKVAVGLQRLRRGAQVRALGVSGMPPNETRAILEGMGWV